MSLIRTKQRAITAVFPHNANQRFIIANLGVGGLLKNPDFLLGAVHWNLVGSAGVALGRLLLGEFSDAEQNLTGVVDGQTVRFQLDVRDVAGAPEVFFNLVSLGTFAAPGVFTFDGTAGGVFEFQVRTGALEDCVIASIHARVI